MKLKQEEAGVVEVDLAEDTEVEVDFVYVSELLAQGLPLRQEQCSAHLITEGEDVFILILNGTQLFATITSM